MILIATILASFVLGAAVAAYLINRRWQQVVNQAKSELTDMANQYRAHETENRSLRQKTADLQYQVNTLEKDLAYERSRQSHKNS